MLGVEQAKACIEVRVLAGWWSGKDEAAEIGISQSLNTDEEEQRLDVPRNVEADSRGAEFRERRDVDVELNCAKDRERFPVDSCDGIVARDLAEDVRSGDGQLGENRMVCGDKRDGRSGVG